MLTAAIKQSCRSFLLPCFAGLQLNNVKICTFYLLCCNDLLRKLDRHINHVSHKHVWVTPAPRIFSLYTFKDREVARLRPGRVELFQLYIELLKNLHRLQLAFIRPYAAMLNAFLVRSPWSPARFRNTRNIGEHR